MDTLWRHKSFLLTTAFLLLTSYFTAREPMEPQTDAEVPVVGPELKAEPLVRQPLSFAGPITWVR